MRTHPGQNHAQDGGGRGLFINSTGSTMYMTGLGTNSVYEYALGTDWEIDTASLTTSHSVSTQVSLSMDVFFSTDGGKMFVQDANASEAVYQYTLGTAWDVSSATYDAVSVATAAEVDDDTCMAMSADKLFIGDKTSGTCKVFVYTA